MFRQISCVLLGRDKIGCVSSVKARSVTLGSVKSDELSCVRVC